METKLKYFRRKGSCGVIYLSERYLGIQLWDSLETTDEKIAELQRREIHIAIERGEYTNWKKTFKEAVKESIEGLFAGKSVKTRKNFEASFRLHLVPWFGKARILDIQADDLVEYKRARWTLKRYGRDIKAPEDPFLKPHRPVDRFPVEDEVLTIVGKFTRTDIKAVALVAAYSGLRRVDILRLKWSAIDFKDGWIKVREKKTAGWVEVPLQEKLVEALNLVPRGLGDAPVFPNVTKASLTDNWRRARQKAGLEWIRFQDLRHFFASYLASNG